MYAILIGHIEDMKTCMVQTNYLLHELMLCTLVFRTMLAMCRKPKMYIIIQLKSYISVSFFHRRKLEYGLTYQHTTKFIININNGQYL